MSGNSTSLYSSSTSNITLSSNNLTTLYPGTSGTVTPAQPYGNANVVGLLAAGTDGANTVTNISATGNITGGNLLTPGQVSATGNITTAGYFLGTFAGNISGNLTVPGSNTQVLYNNQGNAGASAGFTFNSASNVVTVAGNIQGGNVTATGNVAGTYFIGNGSQLTGIASSSYGNAQVAAYLSSGTVASNIITSANISGSYILGNGSQLTGLPATYGNANVVSLLSNFGSNTISTTGNVSGGNINGADVYSVGVVSAAGNVRGANINTTGLITATGNITGNYIIGNGSQLTGLPAGYSNADVATFLASFGSNSISTTGNVTAGNFVGNGAGLTNLTGANVTGSVAQANTANTANAVAGANVSGQVANALIAGTVYTNAQPNITSVGTLTSASVTGNVTGGLFIGNGAGLTNINAGNIVGAYGNANVANFLGSYGSNTLSTTGNVTTGNLNVQLDAVITGNLTVNGNTTLVNSNVVTINDKFINVANNASTAAQADGGGLGVGPVGGEYATLTYNSTNNNWNTNIPLSVNGNVTGGNISATGNIYAPNVAIIGGNIQGQVLVSNVAAGNLGLNVIAGNAYIAGRIVTDSYISAAGNITGANLLTNGAVSATGNVTGSYVIGNGSALTSITGANVTGTVANATYATSAGTATSAVTAGTVTTAAQPNITSVGTLTSLTSSGNVSGGNILTGGIVSATGNITGNYILGNGSQLTGLPATYSNANVATFLATFGSNTISTTGNITAGYFLGNGSQLTGLTGNIVPTATGNINMNGYNISDSTRAYVLINDGLSAVGNITTGNYVFASQASVSGTVQAGVLNVGGGNAYIDSTGYISALGNITSSANILAGGRVSATGNILSGASISATGSVTALGVNAGTGGVNSTGAISGSQLTVTAGFYGTGNVTAGNLVTGGSANVGTLTTTGNAEIGTNLYVTGGITAPGSAINAGSLSVTGNIRGGGYGYNLNMNGGNLISIGGGVGSAIAVNGNIDITGNINMGVGAMSASGNITGNYFIGNGSLLTGVTSSSYTNANVATFLAAFGSNTISTTGTVTAGNITGSNVSTGGLITATGNITGGNLVTSGILSTGGNANISGNINMPTADANILLGGTVGLRNYNNRLYVNTDVDVNGRLSAVANVTAGGNLVASGYVTATGNITGNYFIGNGSQLTGITASAAGSNTQITYNNAGTSSGSALMTFDNTVGNVQLSNMIIGSNPIGNLALGNAAVRMNTPDAYTGTSLNNNGFLSGQIVIGNGFFGNLNINNIQARPAAKFNVWDSANVVEATGNSIRYQALNGTGQISISNVANTSSLVRGGVSTMAIGGGPSANSWTATGQGMGAVLAFNQFLAVGQPNTVAALGNVTLSGAAAMLGQHFVYAGSNVGNAGGVNSQINNAGNITNAIGLTSQFSGTPTLTPTNVFGYYMPGTTNSYGPTNSNGMRAATNYYFLRNDDAVAQTQLGSLRSYNEYRYDTATSGSFTLDKNNAQVQYIAPTANVTITGYDNMVTSLSDSVNTDQEIDTLTVLVQQGATPYTVTLPTGATYQYAGNISTVPAVANSRSILTVVAANIAGTVNYFTTVQSDQTTQEVAGGANTQIQFNNGGVLAGNSLMTFNNTTGNVTLANVIVGVSPAGNVAAGNGAVLMNTTLPFSGQLNTQTGWSNSQIVMGNGYFGNLTQSLTSGSGIRGAKFAIADSALISDTGNVGIRYAAFGIQNQAIIQGTATANVGTFFRAQSTILALGGGPSGNTMTQAPANAGGQGLAFAAGGGGAIFIGQNPSAPSIAMGNTTISGASGVISQIFTYPGTVIGNAAGVFSQFSSTGNIPNVAGYVAQFTSANATAATQSDSVYGFYMPGSSASSTMSGITNTNNYRRATNYYFLRNDDSVAQNQLGSLRAYHTYQYPAVTSGTVDVNKQDGQIQYINPTGNITIGSYTNFVTTANDGTNNDSQSDTVTLIIEQGATPYTVTMPTGNASIKYAGGTSTVANTANAVTTITIQAFRSSGNASMYLTTISPEFS